MGLVLSGTIEADVVPSALGGNWWQMTGKNIKFADLPFESYTDAVHVDFDVRIEGIHDSDALLEEDPRVNGRWHESVIGIMHRPSGEAILLIEVGALEGKIFELICPSS